MQPWLRGRSPGVEYEKEKRRESLKIMLSRRCVRIDMCEGLSQTAV